MRNRPKNSGGGGGSAILFLLALFSASCGLLNDDTLDAPGYIAPDANTFMFVHPAYSNSQATNFSGYQVLYKIYRSAADAQTDASRISQFIDTTSSYGTLMNSYGYRNMLTEAGQSILIPVDSATDGQTFTVRIDFSNTANSGAQLVLRNSSSEVMSGYPLEAYRNISSSSAVTSSLDTFSASAIDASDTDIASATAAEESTWTVQAYAFSKGLDSTSISVIYSAGIALGSVQFSR